MIWVLILGIGWTVLLAVAAREEIADMWREHRRRRNIRIRVYIPQQRRHH